MGLTTKARKKLMKRARTLQAVLVQQERIEAVCVPLRPNASKAEHQRALHRAHQAWSLL